MSNISVNITELKQLLEATPASHNIMLVGNHGIGKSEILTEFFKEKGMPVVALFLGQMADPGDLIGLPNKDEKTGKTDFMPPYWFPIDGKPIVLFLDELNRARPEILQTVMDLALNRKLAGKKLPEGSRIISAVNAGDQYQLTDLDPALVSRFNIVNFRPTEEEWLLWARKNGLDSRVIGFIDENRMCMAAPVSYINDIRTIASIDNFMSINNAVDIDLFGQVCAESLGTTHYSGSGGQVDFVRGANMSKGGKGFIAMTSTAKNGEISKIKPILTPGSIVTTSKNEVDFLVTENNIVRLKGRTASERAKMIISLAAPEFREELTFEAKKMNLIV